MADAELPGALGVDYDVITLLNGTVWQTHGPAKCQDTPCAIHNPSDHHMATWPLNFREDTGVSERICPHGIGHPDPDFMNYAADRWGEDEVWSVGIHGCDGCCVSRGRNIL